MTLIRPLVICAGLLLLWQALVAATGVPPYILPGPILVLQTWSAQADLILENAAVTLTEMMLGFVLGVLLGMSFALSLIYARGLRPWLLPVLVASQAIPVFAIAPVLALWFGYGIASKVAMATMIIFFPVTATFYDGLRRTEPGWLDLATTMNAPAHAVLWQIRVPAALPALASGLRTAAAFVPIGAIVGEWVGSSAGLGFLMLHANGQMNIALMFAALLTLAVMSLGFYFLLDAVLRRAIAWQPDSDFSSR